MSIEQHRAQALNKTIAMRNVGGVSSDKIREAIAMEQIASWFSEVYNRLDDKIRIAEEQGQTELSTELHNMRATMRDYEPRPGDTSERATDRMEDLYLEMKDVPDKFAGTFQEYVRKLVNTVKEASIEGVEAADAEMADAELAVGGEEAGEEVGGGAGTAAGGRGGEEETGSKDFEAIMGLEGEAGEEEELEPGEEVPEESAKGSDNSLTEAITLIGDPDDTSMKEIASILMSLASQGVGQFTVGSLAKTHGYQKAQKIVAEAYRRNLIQPVIGGSYRLKNNQLLQGFIGEQKTICEEKEIGDTVTVVSDGMEYEAMVKSKDNGKYKLSFGDDAPEDHEDEKEYDETEFGEE